MGEGSEGRSLLVKLWSSRGDAQVEEGGAGSGRRPEERHCDLLDDG